MCNIGTPQVINVSIVFGYGLQTELKRYATTKEEWEYIQVRHTSHITNQKFLHKDCLSFFKCKKKKKKKKRSKIQMIFFLFKN